MNAIELIQKLSNANGVSGFEDEVLDVVRDYVQDLVNIKEDQLRNLYLYRKNHSGQKPVCMIDGHSDEVGFMVQSIQKNGTLKIINLGGWLPETVIASKLKIKNKLGDYIAGVVASKPPHFSKNNNKNTVPDISELVIDVGACSKEEIINDYQIEVGAPIIPDSAFSYDESRQVMLGKAFDNRLGCAAVIGILHEIHEMDLSVDVVASISSQEEVGLRGAEVAAKTIKPNIAIVFEGTPADDTWEDKDSAQSCLHKGPQTRYRDNSMIANPRLIAFAKNVANQKEIQIQEAVRRSGGTDAGKIHLSHYGVPCLVIGVPVRYAHSHYGFSSFKDYQAAVKWGVEIIKQLNKEKIESF